MIVLAVAAPLAMGRRHQKATTAANSEVSLIVGLPLLIGLAAGTLHLPK